MKPNVAVWKHLTLKGSPWCLIFSLYLAAAWRRRTVCGGFVHVCVCGITLCCRDVIHLWKRQYFFKISNYPEELQVISSWRCPLLPMHISAEEEAALTLRRMWASDISVRGGSPLLGWHIWKRFGLQEGVKEGAHHCWMRPSSVPNPTPHWSLLGGVKTRETTHQITLPCGPNEPLRGSDSHRLPFTPYRCRRRERLHLSK